MGRVASTASCDNITVVKLSAARPTSDTYSEQPMSNCIAQAPIYRAHEFPPLKLAKLAKGRSLHEGYCLNMARPVVTNTAALGEILKSQPPMDVCSAEGYSNLILRSMHKARNGIGVTCLEGGHDHFNGLDQGTT